MSLKFGEPKSINTGNLKMISIKTGEVKPLYVRTEKCFSFGVKKDKKFKTTSMSLVLDENSVRMLEDVIEQCEIYLGKPLTQKVLYRKDDKVTVYPKYKDSTKLYETEGETDPVKYEGKHCEAKAVLEIGGSSLNGDNLKLQLKFYEALVREKVYEHVRLVDMEW